MQTMKPMETIEGEKVKDRPATCVLEDEADLESGCGSGSGSSTCGSTASAEDVESPKSVVAAAKAAAAGGRWRMRKSSECLHSQVLRLKEEESQLGEDVGEGFTANYKKIFSPAGEVVGRRRSSRSLDDVVFYSRAAILPSSPLSGNRSPLRGVH